MATVLEALAALGGVASTRALSTAGVSRRSLESGVAGGSVHRIARGVYAHPQADPVLVHAGRHHAALGCVSAAQAAGLWVVRRPHRPHLAAQHGRPIPGCIVHRSKIPLTHLDIVVQALRCLPPLEGLTIAESAVKTGLIQLPALRERFPAVREKGMRKLVSRIRPQSGSIIETMARYLLEEAGLTVELQVSIPGMGHLDLLVDGLLGIETDGYAHHSSREAYREDRRRWNVTVVRGVPTLRVTFEMLLNEPSEFVRMVQRALAAYRTAQ
ncbi:very-short-patch-repair endonuclease [Pseudarthrobacter defluvii]|uniref:type IV toxin-antitoxin system AbiEi family antitoxin domain-containing protein n=1 Tax=Pseudarthrobacter defluvii TaxID=410837 RepID=UPI002781A7EC|nr:type IV toxin-antitoxin system AbiEi family antitoxin domain-containing protein [Pseudarthrobacter defluvii]MDQ0768450.1 very-short-patch-repair endonuclease [Pseudarthrobacter defluvii]